HPVTEPPVATLDERRERARDAGFLTQPDPAGRHRLRRRSPLRGGLGSDPLREAPQGFTMVEVMVAILLTALTVIGVLGLFRIETRASSFSRRETEAAVLAQDKLEELRTFSASEPSGNDTPDNPFGTTSTDNIFTREWTIAPNTADPSILDITVTVTWDD